MIRGKCVSLGEKVGRRLAVWSAFVALFVAASRDAVFHFLSESPIAAAGKIRRGKWATEGDDRGMEGCVCVFPLKIRKKRRSKSSTRIRQQLHMRDDAHSPASHWDAGSSCS